MKFSTLRNFFRESKRTSESNSSSTIHQEEMVVQEGELVDSMIEDEKPKSLQFVLNYSPHKKEQRRKRKKCDNVKRANRVYSDLWCYIADYLDEPLRYFLTEFRLICRQTLEAASRYTKLDLNGILGNRLFSMICNNMTQLKILKLEKRVENRKKIGITDLSPLKKGNLAKLEYLNLQNNSISNATIFNLAKNMENLKYLNLKGNKIKQWDCLANNKLKNIEYLNLNANSITDVYVPFNQDNSSQECNLKTLKLGGNNLTNDVFKMVNMNYFSNLTNLDLKNNKDINTVLISGISRLIKLEKLNISGTRISDLNSVISSFPNLRILKFSNIDYEGKSTMSNILKDLSPSVHDSQLLENNIESLYLHDMKIGYTNIVELSQLKLFQHQLTKLVLSGNNIGDYSIETLSSVPNQLTSLNINTCSLTDYCTTYLFKFPNLKYLDIGWNFLSNTGCTALMLMNLDFLDINNNSSIDYKLIASHPSSIKKIIYGWGRINKFERVNP